MEELVFRTHRVMVEKQMSELFIAALEQVGFLEENEDLTDLTSGYLTSRGNKCDLSGRLGSGVGKHGRPREGEAGSGATIQGSRGLPKGQEKAGKQNSSLSF